jgi:hypothetical protein
VYASLKRLKPDRTRRRETEVQVEVEEESRFLVRSDDCRPTYLVSYLASPIFVEWFAAKVLLLYK